MLSRTEVALFCDNLIKAAIANNVHKIRDIMTRLAIRDLHCETRNLDTVVNATDSEGNTALICAAGRGNVEAVNALLSNFNVNAQNSRTGYTALHCAAIRGRVDVVKCLLGVRDIDLDIKDIFHNTAADEAKNNSMLEMSSSHMEIYRLIMEARRVRAVYTPAAAAAVAAAPSIPESHSSIESSTPSSSASAKIESPAVLSLQKQLEAIGFDGEIPPHFQDPVTLDILDADCIAVSSGYIYSRSVLRNWFETSGMPITIPCPVTRKPIHKDELNNAILYPLRDGLINFVRQAKEDKVKQEQASAAAARLKMFGATLPASSMPSISANITLASSQNDDQVIDDSRSMPHWK